MAVTDSKMRWLFTTDWHICDRRPGARIDSDFFAIQLAKIEEILTIASTYKVDRILHGGDLFDRPLMDLHIINTVIEVLKKATAPIEIVLGNHDLLGYNENTVARTALGTLLKAGVIKETTLSHVNVTNKHQVNLYQLPGPIIMTHNMVSPTELLFDHLLCKDIAPICPNTVVLCGHYHTAFTYYDKTYNTTFVNTGNLVRTSIAEASHAPYVVIGEDNAILERVFIKAAQSGNQVFDLQAHTEFKQREKSFNKFVTSLQEAKSITEGHDLISLITTTAFKEKIDERIRQEALRRVAFAKDSIPS